MTAPMLSSSRLSASAVILLPVSDGGDLEHLAGHGLLEAVDAGDAVLHLEHGTDLLDVELVEIRGFDLAEEDVLDLAGAQRGLGGHRGSGLWGRGISGRACEIYHKLGFRAIPNLPIYRHASAIALAAHEPLEQIRGPQGRERPPLRPHQPLHARRELGRRTEAHQPRHRTQIVARILGQLARRQQPHEIDRALERRRATCRERAAQVLARDAQRPRDLRGGHGPPAVRHDRAPRRHLERRRRARAPAAARRARSRSAR